MQPFDPFRLVKMCPLSFTQTQPLLVFCCFLSSASCFTNVIKEEVDAETFIKVLFWSLKVWTVKQFYKTSNEWQLLELFVLFLFFYLFMSNSTPDICICSNIERYSILADHFSTSSTEYSLADKRLYNNNVTCDPLDDPKEVISSWVIPSLFPFFSVTQFAVRTFVRTFLLQLPYILLLTAPWLL